MPDIRCYSKLNLAFRWTRNAFFLLLGRTTPLVILAAITHRCNLRCPYCGVWKEADSELNTDEWCSLLEEATSEGTASVSFCGGEPLLRDDLGELISRSVELGLRTSLTTNAWFVDDRRQRLTDLHSITISLDGPEETNDNIRGAGSYRRIMKALEWAVDNGKETYTSTVLSRYNVGVIEYICDLAEKMDIFAFFQPATQYAYGGDAPSHWALTLSELNGIGILLEKLKQDGARIGNSYSFIRQMQSIPDEGSRTKCMAGQSFLTVLPDGRLVPCHIQTDKNAPVFRPGRFAEAYSNVSVDCSQHCVIAPYFEYDAVLGHPTFTSALRAWNVLRAPMRHLKRP